MPPLRSVRSQNPIVLALGIFLLALFTFYRLSDRSRLLSPCFEIMNPGRGYKICQSETCDKVLNSGAKTCDTCSHVQLSKRQRTGNTTASATGSLSSGLVVPLSPARVSARAVTVTQGQASSRQQPSSAPSRVASSAPSAPAPALRGLPETSDSHDADWGWEDQASHFCGPEAGDFIAFCQIDQSSKIKAIVSSARGVQSYAVCGFSINESDGTLNFQVAMNFKKFFLRSLQLPDQILSPVSIHFLAEGFLLKDKFMST